MDFSSHDKKGKIKQIKKNNYLENIKSTFILKKIIIHLNDTKSLEIIKYNKTI